MKPTELDLRQIHRQETRLRTFKEKNFEACGYDEPKSAFIAILLASIFFAVSVLLILAIIFS